MALKTALLSEIAEIIVGYPFKSENFNTEEKGIRLVRGVNVSNKTIRWGSDTRWWNKIEPYLDAFQLRIGDIIVAMDGYVGKNIARITPSDIPSLLVQRVACIRAKTTVNQDYLWSCISSKNFEGYINSIKTGTTISHISGKQIGEYQIPVHSRKIQEFVGGIVSSIDSKIHLNQSINDNLRGVCFAS